MDEAMQSICHNSKHLVFQCSKALYQGPECIRGPPFIRSPIALGLLSQRRWEAMLDSKLPPPALSLSQCSPAWILYQLRILFVATSKQSEGNKCYEVVYCSVGAFL